MNKEEYIKKWLNDTLTEGERKEFESSSDYTSLERMMKTLQSYKAPSYDSEAEYERLKNQLDVRKKSLTVQWMPSLLKVAAVVSIIVLGYIFLLKNDMRVVETSTGERATVILPDSSLVVLGALSSISYDTDGWPEKRDISLKGEAFFQAAKGSDFQVRSASGKVSVLGTEFNIREREGLYEVICYEGLVRVNTSSEDIKLSASSRLRVMDGELAIDQDNSYPHLLKSESAFQSVPVNLQQHYSGSFTHQDVEIALQAIALPLNLSYSIDSKEKQIIISGATN